MGTSDAQVAQVSAQIEITRTGRTYVLAIDGEEIYRGTFVPDCLHLARHVLEHRIRDAFDI